MPLQVEAVFDKREIRSANDESFRGSNGARFSACKWISRMEHGRRGDEKDGRGSSHRGTRVSIEEREGGSVDRKSVV